MFNESPSSLFQSAWSSLRRSGRGGQVTRPGRVVYSYRSASAGATRDAWAGIQVVKAATDKVPATRIVINCHGTMKLPLPLAPTSSLLKRL